jgi:nicotinamide-nucleotide amidase
MKPMATWDDLVALAERLGPALHAQGLVLATAESCTGGLLSAAVTAVAGSSTWFECGFVCYGNKAKERLLGVPAASIAAHGAVSEEVALALAEGALSQSSATLSLAITGIAGPGGATPGKPVGTVWHALGRQTASGRILYAQLRHYEGDRGQVRMQAAAYALRSALQELT